MVGVKALAFDIFGTTMDWRGTLIREGERFGVEHDVTIDWSRFADEWRARYRPSMNLVTNGALPWTNLDGLHRRSLDELLEAHSASGLSASQKNALVRLWHHLDPWPDVLPGLARLSRRFLLVTLSNGNMSMLVDIAKNAGLPWDAILSAELMREYKPARAVFDGAARLLDLRPEQMMMVSSHPVVDLVPAHSLGWKTAFVRRPRSAGATSRDTSTPAQAQVCDVVVTDFADLASRLGC